jgi:AcrR family transcriptional regulator
LFNYWKLNIIAGKRARTEAQKQARLRMILSAAELHLADVGFEAFSMAALARQLGMANGTLYLYVETREHLLLALFNETLEKCAVIFVNALPLTQTDLDVVSLYYDTLITDPIYLSLASRLDSVIEHNVSITALIVAKRKMLVTINGMSVPLSEHLAMSTKQAFDAVLSLASLWLGAAQSDTGPAFEDREMPEDVSQIMKQFTARNVFISNACRILQGIRLEAL